MSRFVTPCYLLVIYLLFTRPFILLKEETKQAEYLLSLTNPYQWFSIQFSTVFNFLRVFCFLIISPLFPLSFLCLLLYLCYFIYETCQYHSLCHITSPYILAFIDMSLVSYVHPGFHFLYDSFFTLFQVIEELLMQS